MHRAMTANQVADMVVANTADVVDARWYRNKPETEKIMLTVDLNKNDRRKILIPKGSHELYDSFAKVL